MVVRITEFFDESELDKEELRALEILRQRQNQAVDNLTKNFKDLHPKRKSKGGN